MTRRVNPLSPRWWKNERIQHSQDLQENGYPSTDGSGAGKGLELWSSSKSYSKDDVVFFNSPDVKGIFVANENIPASGFLNIGIDGPTWSIVGDEFAGIPNWYSMEWPANSVVVRSGALRRAIGNTSSSWVESEWENLTPVVAPADTDLLFENHSDTKEYKKDQVVVVDGKLYRARSALSALPFDLADWEELSPSSAAGLTEVIVDDFDTAYAYKAKELAVVNDKLYRAINATGPGVFVTSDWKEISAAGANATIVSDFTTSKTYVKDELVAHNARLYRALRAVSAGAFSLTNFTPADASGIVDTFDAAATYNRGEVVRHQGSFFMAANNVAAGPFNPAGGNWTYIGGGTVTTTNWNNALFYPYGATVFKDKSVFRSKENQMAGAWDDAKWEPIASLHGRLSAFNATETYYKDMVATFNGYAYQVTAVSAAPSASPEGNPNWQKLWPLSLFPNVLPYTATASYKSGDLVMAEGRLLRANKTIASAPLGITPADWDPTSQKSLAVWSVTDTSFVGDTFIDNGVLYRCKVNNRGAWVAANFEEIGQLDQFKEYDPTKKYILNQVVTRNGQILRCESNVSAVGYDSDDWDMIGHLKGVRPWADVDTYETHDVVLHLGIAWQANGHVPAGQFNFGAWTRKSGTPAISDFIPDFPYDIGDIIKIGNNLYINNVGTLRAAIDLADWTQFGQLRGLWLLDQSYLAEDIVIKGNNLYRANGDIPVNTAFVQGAGSSEWTRLSPSEPPSAPDFAPLQAYKKDSLVIRGGKLYRSKLEFTSLASWDDNDWEALVAEAAASVPDFVLAKDYVLNQVVAQDGVLYRARSVITAAQADKLPAVDPTNWQAVSLTYIHVPDHSDTGTYALNECVINPADNRMYRAKTAITTGRAFAEVDWQLIADRLPNILVWDKVTAANNVWFLGDIIQKDDGIFIASKNQTVGTLTWPTANVKRLNRASNFYGHIGDNTHNLPVGAIFVNGDGDIVEMLKTDVPTTTDTTAIKVISNHRVRQWDAAGQYLEGTAVHFMGVYYHALRYNTNKSPDVNAADWEVSHDVRSWFAFWSSSNDYLNGEIVIRGGQFYQATTDNAAGTFESGSWARIGGSTAVVKNWNEIKASNVWNAGDFIVRYGDTYLAEASAAPEGEDAWPNAKLNRLILETQFLGTEIDSIAHQVKIGDVFISERGHVCRYTVDGDPTTFVGSYYDIINFSLDHLETWTAAEFPKGHMALYENKIWRAASAAVAADIPDGVGLIWHEVAPSQVSAENFVDTRDYAKNELVVNGGKLYRAKDLTPAGVWDEANFEALGGSGGIATWDSTKDYSIDTEVRWDSSIYRATEEILQGGTAPDVNGKWTPVNKASGFVKLVPGETVKVGDIRIHNSLGLMANVDSVVDNPIEEATLEKWDVIFGKMGSANYTAKGYFAAGTAHDFTLTANWNKAGSIALPASDNFLFWKNKGARFYLNGQPLGSSATGFGEKGFTVNDYYIESGDVISVVF